MLILNNFLYGFLLGICPYIIKCTLELADAVRGYDVLGGEMFIYFLPIVILIWRFYAKGVEENENVKKQSQRNS